MTQITRVSELGTHDVVEILTEALKDAKEGDMRGVVLVSLFPRRRVILAAGGSAYDDPFFACGALQGAQLALLRRLQSSNNS